MTTATLPPRKEVTAEDCWDLSSLYADDQAWEADFKKLDQRIPTFESFRGRLGESAAVLAEALHFDSDFDRTAERLGTYAFLKTTEDQSDSDYQGMKARFQNLAVRASQAASYMRPELLAIEDQRMAELMADDAVAAVSAATRAIGALSPAHVDRQRRTVAGDARRNGIGRRQRVSTTERCRFAFRRNRRPRRTRSRIVACHVRTIADQSRTKGPSQSVRAVLRAVRRSRKHAGRNALPAASNATSTTLEAKNYESSLEAALFPDNVPVDVYDNLITAVRDSLPTVHHYLDVRRRKMGLKDIHHYDTYVPILSDIEKHHTWDQPVEVVIESLAPLGTSTPACWRRDCVVAGPIAIRIAASKAAPSVAVRSTAIRTS